VQADRLHCHATPISSATTRRGVLLSREQQYARRCHFSVVRPVFQPDRSDKMFSRQGSSMLVAFLVLSCGVHGALVSPVQKVIMLIEDMATKVGKDQEAAAAAYTESAKFCDQEVTEKGFAIKDSKKNIEKLSAIIEDKAAKTDELETKIADLAPTISAAEGELDTALKLRAKENADFVAIEKELLSTVEKLDGAKETLEKTFSLAQLTPEAKQNLSKMLEGLSVIVEASFVTHAQRSKVQAFLQAQEDSDDSDGVKAHGSGGDAIIETLDEMIDKAEGTLADTRKEEMGKAQAHAMLKQSLENEIKSFKEELAEATQGKQVAAETAAQAEKDLAVEKKGLAGDSAYTHDLKRDCMVKSQEWEVNHRDSQAELKALSTAKGILAKKFAVFVQTTAKHKLQFKVPLRSNGDSSKARALRIIEQLGRTVHSTALVSLAYRAAADPFSKVRGMIEDMIQKLMQEAAEEASQKAFCDTEMGESQKSKADKAGKLDKLKARIEKGDSAVAELTGQIATRSKELAEIDASVKEATEIRNAEKSEFMRAEKDFSESQQACVAALEVLTQYYEGAALVQVSAKVRVSSKSSEDATTSGDGTGIIGVLEVAESDFAKSLADVRSTESVAQDEYDKMTQDAKLEKVTKEMEVKGAESQVKQLQTSLSNYNEDKAGLDTELQAVLDYLDELKPQCETKAPSYAEIKAKRDKEIAGLKEGLSVLSQ